MNLALVQVLVLLEVSSCQRGAPPLHRRHMLAQHEGLLRLESASTRETEFIFHNLLFISVTCWKCCY